MFCYNCGKEVPADVSVCPNCNTPVRRRGRVKRRMFLGMIIFILGVICGGIFDRIILQKGVNIPLLASKPQSKTAAPVSVTKAEETALVPQKEPTEIKIETISTKENIPAEAASNDVPVDEGSKVVAAPQKNEIQLDGKLFTEAGDFEEAKEESSSDVVSAKASQEKNDIKSVKSEKAENIAVAEKRDLPVETALAFSEKKVTEKSEKAEKIEKAEVGVEQAVPEIKIEHKDVKIQELAAVEVQPKEIKKELPISKAEVLYEEDTEEGDYVLIPVDSEVLEDSSYCDFHGIVSKYANELVFSSNRQSIDGKRYQQCFVKSFDDGEAYRPFKWRGDIWTPEPLNKEEFVFSSNSSGHEHIFVCNRTTKEAEQLTDGSSKNMMCSVSPDARKIVYVSNRGGKKNAIWLMDADGSNKKQLTEGDFDDREPRWADNGRSIVFTRIITRLEKSNIMKLYLDDGRVETLVDNGRRNWMADMSPDGTTLAYTRSEGTKGSNNTIVLRNVKTGKEYILSVPGRTENMRPVWNDDSMGFVYHSIVKHGKSRSLHMAHVKREIF